MLAALIELDQRVSPFGHTIFNHNYAGVSIVNRVEVGASWLARERSNIKRYKYDVRSSGGSR